MKKSTFVRPALKRAYRMAFVSQLTKKLVDYDIPANERKNKAKEVFAEILPFIDFSTPADMQETANEQADKIMKRDFILKSVDYTEDDLKVPDEQAVESDTTNDKD